MDNQALAEVGVVMSVLAFAGWMLYLLFKRYQLSTRVLLHRARAKFMDVCKRMGMTMENAI